MKKAYTTSQIRSLEKLAVENYGISEPELMRRAGKAAFDCMKLQWPNVRHLLVLCGSGNNGGDGYVLAKLAKEAELKVSVRLVGDPQKLSETAKMAFDACEAAGVEMLPYQSDEAFDAELIIDALLGVGLKGEVREEYREIIQRVNQSELPVFAIDVPSGIDADTGKVCGDAILADATITFIALKQGLLTGSAKTHCGRISCDALGLTTDQLSEVEAASELLSYESLCQLLPPRPADTHKGDFGHVLVLGGNHGMGGAARMAGEAAGRAGAGWISVVMQLEYIGPMTAMRPELMCHYVKTAAELEPLLAKATTLILGAGLGQDDWAEMLFSTALNTQLPMVVDADGLNLLAKHPVKNENWILTPHPGEAAKLLNCQTVDIQADRFGAAKALVDQYGGVVVLKGAGTLIQSMESSTAIPVEFQGAGKAQVKSSRGAYMQYVSSEMSVQHSQNLKGNGYICTIGNPGMASGGMGDVLGGIIGGLLAQKLSLKEAACLGVWIHAAAGDNVALQQGERGMLATDLMLEIAQLVNFYEYDVDEL